MTLATLTNFLDKLDFTNPEDLYLAFHTLRSWPRIAPLVDSDEGFRDFEVIELYQPMIFGRADDDFTGIAVEAFLKELGGFYPSDAPGAFSDRPAAPREWMHVFRVAFDRGNIGPVALGAAYAFLEVCSGNAAPWLERGSVEARRVMVNDARRASPLGLMSGDERSKLALLPHTLTVWRGGQGDWDETPLERAMGLHWTPNYSYAAGYMCLRGKQRGGATGDYWGAPERSTEAAVRAVLMAGTMGKLIEKLGEPFLLRATIPKDLVLAYRPWGEVAEMLIDFERLTPEMIEDARAPRVYLAA